MTTPKTPKIAWCSRANLFALHIKNEHFIPLEKTALGQLFVEALQFVPNREPLNAVVDFAVASKTDRIGAADALQEFVLAWLSSESSEEHDCQGRRDIV